MAVIKKSPEFLGLTNGGNVHPLYRLRKSIIYRCYTVNPSRRDIYNTYRGKGIEVFEDWRLSIKSFYDWAINAGWQNGLTIDRINSDGNYEPLNCRFITRSENSKKARIEHDQKGENSSVSKLNNDKVKIIRKLLEQGFTHRYIAQAFNVGKTAITSIKLNQTWKHV